MLQLYLFYNHRVSLVLSTHGITCAKYTVVELNAKWKRNREKIVYGACAWCLHLNRWLVAAAFFSFEIHE